MPVTPFGLEHPAQYNFAKAKAYCEHRGLTWNFDIAKMANEIFHNLSLSQDQAEKLMLLYVDNIAWMWDRKTYGWKARLGLVLHFLGLIPNRIKGREG